MKTTCWCTCTTQYSIPQTTAEKYEKIKLSTIQQTLILSKTIKHHLIFQKFGDSFPYYTFLSLHPIQKNRNFLLSGNRHACPLLLARHKTPPPLIGQHSDIQFVMFPNNLSWVLESCNCHLIGSYCTDEISIFRCDSDKKFTRDYLYMF